MSSRRARHPIERLLGAAAKGLSAVLLLACDSRSPIPVAPSSLSPAPAAATAFTVSGIVSEYRGGRLTGVTVRARPNVPPGNGVKTTVTDASGSYRFVGLTEPIIIDAEKDGYMPGLSGVILSDRVVNLTMTRRMQVAAGGTLTATIWGDSHMFGEDWSGANCDVEAKPCALIRVMSNGPGTLTVRLAWAGPENQLGVFISTGFFDGRGTYGSSPLETSLEVLGGETLVVVSFEKSGGARPRPNAGQAFELTASLVPKAASAGGGW